MTIQITKSIYNKAVASQKYKEGATSACAYASLSGKGSGLTSPVCTGVVREVPRGVRQTSAKTEQPPRQDWQCEKL